MIVWVLMEIVYSIFIGMISSKIAGKIVGIRLQCRDTRRLHARLAYVMCVDNRASIA